MLEWLRYKWFIVVVAATLFIYMFCICYDFINKRHKLKHHESYYLKKIFGIVLMILGASIATYVIYVAVYNANSAESGLGAIIALFVTLSVAVPLITFGAYLLFHKKPLTKMEKSLGADYFICPICGKIYDKTWKVCLKCGKPLVEKK